MKFAVALLLVIALIQGVALLEDGGTNCGDRKIIAYFNTGYLGDMPTDGVDYILFAFAFARDSDGSIYLDQANADKLQANLPVMLKLKEERPGLKTLISVGGYEMSDLFPIIAVDETKRLNFAKTTREFMSKYQFDGMDLDWEFKTCSEATHYIDLVRAFRVTNPDKLLTATVFRRPSRMSCLDYITLTPMVDYYNLLTYEYYGPWSKVTGFNTPLGHDKGEPCYLDIETSTNVFLGLKGVHANKVVLGLAFYGQQFSGTEGFYQPFESGLRIDYKDIENVGTAIYNSAAAAVYIQSDTQLTTFDDVQSLNSKCDYIIQQGVAGTVVWELGEDKNGKLLGAVVEKLKDNPALT